MLRINQQRLLDDIEALGQIGAAPQGGVSRPAMSPADLEGRAWFRARVEADGFVFRQDGAGNISAVLPADDPAAPTLLTGSHLDTVPEGGRFDGALGVLSALEALRTIREANLRLSVHLEAISFTDEEGHLFGMLGSRALAGQLTSRDLDLPPHQHAQFLAGMQRLGIDRSSILAARRSPEELFAFVELHIEQGKRLEMAGVDIGVVTSIVGIRSYWLRFKGEAAHAGTMPLADRSDALLGAAAFIRQAREIVMARFSPGVVTCGNIKVRPGAFNVVPAEADLALEFRHGADAQLDAMEAALLDLGNAVAREHRLVLRVETSAQIAPAPMHEPVIAAIEQAAAAIGLSATRLMSFAGHDSQVLSKVVPTAMIFVPSVRGISHSPEEFTNAENIAKGANALLHTIIALGQ